MASLFEDSWLLFNGSLKTGFAVMFPFIMHTVNNNKKPGASSKHVTGVSVQETFLKAVSTREARC